MNTHFFRRVATGTAVGVALLLPSAAHAHQAPEPELRQVGATAVVYNGPQIDLALSYRYAEANPTGSWLLLDTAMTAYQKPIEIRRDAIAVRTPSGDVVPLATQEEFLSDYALLGPTIARANVAREPMNYLLPQWPRRIPFFSNPGRHLVFSTDWLDDLHSSYGRLFFKLPNGVTRGNYELLINLAGGQVVVPFTI
jgi:hypothetical protein